jgi:hypothetical protein
MKPSVARRFKAPEAHNTNRCVSSFAVLILSRVRGMVECDWSHPSPPHVLTRLYMPAKLRECRDPRPFLSITPCHPAPAQGKARFLHDVPSKSITLVYRPRAFGRSSLPIKAGQFTLHVVTCSFLQYVVINVIISFLSSLSLVRNHGHQLRIILVIPYVRLFLRTHIHRLVY